MPVNSFEQIANMAMDRLNPGSTVLMGSYHNGPQGGVAAARGMVHESLENQFGKQIIICGVTKLGDEHVCDK